MEITTELLHHLLTLSKLEIDEKDEEEFKRNLLKTLDEIDKIKDIKTENVEHKGKTVPVQSLRDDEIKESIENELALKNAPKKNYSQFVVSKVVD